MSEANLTKHPPNFQDLTGQRFDRLTVIGYAGRDRTKRSVWTCRCDCSKVIDVKAWNLKNGHQRSCGCLRVELAGSQSVTHGLTETKAYRAWCGMLSRCYNEGREDYPDYGGRGITVCDRWRESFENFFADVGEPPSEQHSIDRIENSGNYEPGNVRWATPGQQSRNKRSNRLITFNGKTQTLSEWGKETGLGSKRIHARLRKKWSVERALTEAAHHNKTSHANRGN